MLTGPLIVTELDTPIPTQQPVSPCYHLSLLCLTGAQPPTTTVTAGTLASGPPISVPAWIPESITSPQASNLSASATPPVPNNKPVAGTQDTTSPASKPVSLHPGLPPIPAHTVITIQEGKFVDLGSLLLEALAAASFDKPSNSKDIKGEKKFPVKNPLEWALAFAMYAAVVAQHNPSRGSSLCTYMMIITGMARQGRPGMWSRYDRAFRQAAALDPSLQWDRCNTDTWLAAEGDELLPRPSAPFEICKRWNRGSCFVPCRFHHACLACRELGHPARDCPTLRPPALRPPLQ